MPFSKQVGFFRASEKSKHLHGLNDSILTVPNRRGVYNIQNCWFIVFTSYRRKRDVDIINKVDPSNLLRALLAMCRGDDVIIEPHCLRIWPDYQLKLYRVSVCVLCYHKARVYVKTRYLCSNQVCKWCVCVCVCSRARGDSAASQARLPRILWTEGERGQPRRRRGLRQPQTPPRRRHGGGESAGGVSLRDIVCMCVCVIVLMCVSVGLCWCACVSAL